MYAEEPETAEESENSTGDIVKKPRLSRKVHADFV